MNMEQITEQVIANGKEIARVHESVKSAHHRIDENDRITEGIHKLAANVEALALQVKMLAGEMRDAIDRIESGQKSQGERIGKLEAEPAGKWRALVTQVISLVIAAVVGGAITRLLK